MIKNKTCWTFFNSRINGRFTDIAPITCALKNMCKIHSFSSCTKLLGIITKKLLSILNLIILVMFPAASLDCFSITTVNCIHCLPQFSVPCNSFRVSCPSSIVLTHFFKVIQAKLLSTLGCAFFTIFTIPAMACILMKFIKRLLLIASSADSIARSREFSRFRCFTCRSALLAMRPIAIRIRFHPMKFFKTFFLFTSNAILISRFGWWKFLVAARLTLLRGMVRFRHSYADLLNRFSDLDAEGVTSAFGIEQITPTVYHKTAPQATSCPTITMFGRGEVWA